MLTETQAASRPRRTSSTPLRRKLLAVAITQAVAGLVSPAMGATITVDDPGDSGGSNCTLRDAIGSANENIALAGCAKGDGIDLITFDSSIVPLTITLQNGPLPIASPMTVQGPGADRLTIFGNNASRIFEVNDLVPTRILSVTLTGMTLSGANSGAAPGGAIINSENLEIRDSTLSGNSTTSEGGGIYNRATVTLTNSEVTFNTAENLGGGIRNGGGATYGAATVVIVGSLISGNTAYVGGGISNYGFTVTVTNSTISGNTADQGGGLFNEAGSVAVHDSTISGNTANQGAAAFDYKGALTVTGSTISGNTANARGAGTYAKGGALTLTNSTVSGNTADGNGGGIYVHSGSITVVNSTVSGNSASEGGGLYANSQVTVSLTNTIIANSPGGGDCSNAGMMPGNVNNLIEDGSCDAEFSGDPMLGPLADYGGPTETHRPMPGSPAIDAGDAADCPEFDQRGFQRPVDGDNDGTAACDIGSVEFRARQDIFKNGFEDP